MTLSKIKDTAAGSRSSLAGGGQPPYHSDVSEEYLTALQRQVDANKPKGFRLTPISEAGW